MQINETMQCKFVKVKYTNHTSNSTLVTHLERLIHTPAHISFGQN